MEEILQLEHQHSEQQHALGVQGILPGKLLLLQCARQLRLASFATHAAQYETDYAFAKQGWHAKPKHVLSSSSHYLHNITWWWRPAQLCLP